MTDNHNNIFAGILPAIASPCDENDLFLEDKFSELADDLYANGINGLYVCGGTGDGYKMQLAERKRATEIAVTVSAKQNGTVITHVGAKDIDDAIELAEHACSVGANAVSSIPPANLNHKELVSYYTEIASNISIPLFVYYIPALTGKDISLDEMLELLDIDGVRGLKISDFNLFLMKSLMIERPNTIIFSGKDEVICPALMYGVHGGIGMWYNLFPKLYVDIYKYIKAGKIEAAMNLQNKILRFCHIAMNVGFISIFNHLMKERGYGEFCFRAPRNLMPGSKFKEIEPKLNKIIEDIISS